MLLSPDDVGDPHPVLMGGPWGTPHQPDGGTTLSDRMGVPTLPLGRMMVHPPPIVGRMGYPLPNQEGWGYSLQKGWGTPLPASQTG